VPWTPAASILNDSAPLGRELARLCDDCGFDNGVPYASMRLVTRHLEDATSLDSMLAAVGTRRDASLDDWLAPYVARRYHAVVLLVSTAAGRVQLPAVHVRFDATSPFYPYREPARRPAAVRDAQGRFQPLERRLLLYVLAPVQQATALGSSVPSDINTVGAQALSPDQAQRLKSAASLGLSVQGPRPWWMTIVRDRSNPRPGNDDLVFAQSARAQPAEPVTEEAKPGAPEHAGAVAPEAKLERTGAVRRSARELGTMVFGALATLSMVVALVLGHESGRKRGQKASRRA
jgi:hypothetical protein